MEDNSPNTSESVPANSKGKINVNVGADPTTNPSQKISLARLLVLSASGPYSNYDLDWEFVVTSYFEAAGVDYILQDTKPKLRPAS
ncbi:hypothetical protein PGT21_017501 [Puccinia graminis f. sp. tritici]|uniref:Uncharacterized protein n=1 Tax=Puccinia graminis f. sp. tritici TaxID=56615 RepID=A0A5B0PTP0_PUCGR|nr:hypothetical protein PGT21_017501 [Puccinia graminis f. sp. tritici]